MSRGAVFAGRLLKAVLALMILVGTVPAAAGAGFATLLFAPLPAKLPDLPEPELIRPTKFFLADGTQVGELRAYDTSLPMTYDDIPQIMLDAVTSSEDRNFWEHGGVDVEGIVRALVTDVKAGEIVQGGSTITQQLVKMTVTGDDITWQRKIDEALLATRLERIFPKEEIMFRYLQTTFFGEGAYGLAAAADTYFRKPVSELTLSEAATLVGIIPAPSVYNPRANLERAQQRRDLVLDTMVETGAITSAEAAKVKRSPLHLAGTGEPPEGATLVHGPRRSHVSAYPYFVDYARRYLEDRYGDRIYTDGFEVYLSLDTRLQGEAEAAVNEQLAGNPAELEMSLVAVEPSSGLVKALVGGRDYDAPGGQVNLALGRFGGGSGRQPGSAFKPFVLATAFNQSIKPTTVLSGAPHQVNGTVVQNYGGAVHGSMNLYQATKISSNTVFTRLIEQVGVENTMMTARNLGLEIADYDPGVHGVSVALGAVETSPLTMASAYGVFANHGVLVEPKPVLLVLDADGNVIEDNREPQGVQVLDPAVADTVTAALQGPLGPGGTAYGKGLPDRPAAGKTGTTQENKDAWFVGYTPQLSTAVWIGYRDAPAPLVGINGVRSVTGGTIPAATWQRFMISAMAELPVVGFNEPAPLPESTEVVTRVEREKTGGFRTGRRMWPASLPTTTTTMPPTTTTTVPVTTTTTPSTTTSTTKPPATTTTKPPSTTTSTTTSSTVPEPDE